MASPEQDRETGLIAYILYGLSIIVGVAIIVAIIFAYVKRDSVAGSFVESHLEWLIRTFWITFIAGIIGGILCIILIGFVILFVVWLWFIYRVVKGFVIFIDGRPIDDPQAWF